MANCINHKHPDIVKMAGELNISPVVLAAKIGVWQEKNNITDRFPTIEEIQKPQEVNYGLKSLEILSSDKAKQVFDKGNKNKWSLDKILTELQIPKEQKQLILDLGITDREQLTLELASNYSYTVEINTSKDNGSIGRTEVGIDDFEKNGSIYSQKIPVVVGDNEIKYFKDNVRITKEEYDKAASIFSEKKPTQYYSNLTVPGGTNYTENEIATPAITPSIIGHAQFSTPNGIGWFRSDEEYITSKEYPLSFEDSYGGIYTKTDNIWYYLDSDGTSHKRNDLDDTDIYAVYDNQYGVKGYIQKGTNTKTRRILEVQSDLFQKGRNNKDLVGGNKFNYKIGKEDGEWAILDTVNDEIYKFYKTEQEAKDDYIKLEKTFNQTQEQYKQNQFLQLLNKDNNWVTFFIKSIIQDSAKKGYEKVLFPTGNTASKVEGHTTLEDFKRQKENRLDYLINKKENYKLEPSIKEEIDGEELVNIDGQDKLITYKIYTVELGDIEGVYNSREEALQGYKAQVNNIIKDIDIEINQLKQELERVEGPEGFAALKPIYNFYENTVTNILKKQGYNPVLITDEYGNTWNEIVLDNQKDTSTILLNKKDLSQFESEDNESIFVEKIVENVSKNKNNFETNKNLLFGEQDITNSFTAQQVLQNIIDSNLKLSKEATDLIFKAMNIMKVANTRVKVISQEQFNKLTTGSEGEGIAVMAYNYDLSNVVYVTENNLKVFSPEIILESFIHELAHNLSIKALLNPETFEEKEFNSLIEKAFEQYKYLGKKLKGSKSYGFTNKKEFVAEIYSNADFRKELQDLDKGFWRKFKDAIRRLFGLPKSLENDNLIDSILLIESVEKFLENNQNVPSIMFKNDYSKSFNNTDFKIIKEAETYDLTTIDKKVEHLVNEAKSKIAELINRTKKSEKEKAQEFLEEYKKLENELNVLSTINQWKAVTSYLISFQNTINKLQKSLNDKFKIKEVVYNNIKYTKIKTDDIFKDENGNYLIPEDMKDKIEKEFFKKNNFIVDDELFNNVENELIKENNTKDYSDLAMHYENYLSAYDLLEDVKKLIDDTAKDATLKREDKLEIKKIKQKLNDIIQPHDRLVAELKKLKKDSFIKLLSDPSNNKKVINKWKNKLSIEYNNLINPLESKMEWIGRQMSTTYAEQIQKDLEEDAKKIVNNPYIDITQFAKNWVDLLNINSPLINIMSNIVGKMRDKIISEITEAGFMFSKYFEDYSKFNNSVSMSKKYGNLIELNENNDTYYLKSKYSIKFKESFDKLISSLIEKNKDVENYDYKQDEEYKNWIKTNTKPDGFGNKIPHDKWLNPKLSQEEEKVLELFKKLTKDNHKDIYNNKGGLYSTFFGAEYYKLPSHTKTNKERTLEGDIKGQIQDTISDLKETKVDDINYGQAFDSRGEELKRIRINYRGNIESKNQSLDLFTIYRAEQTNAITYKNRSLNETKLKLFLDIARDKTYKRKSLLDGKWAKNIFAKDEVKGQVFSGEFSNEVKKIKGILETALYDVTSYDEQKILGNLDANKLTSKLNGITATIGMTLNIGSSTVNFLNGEVMMTMLRIGGKYTNKTNQSLSHANYFKNLPNILADISNPVKKSFHNQMLNMFDVVGGMNINKQDFLNNSTVKELLSSHNLNFTNESVEHMLNSILTESILRSTLVMNNDYKYIDKDGNVTTKDKAASVFDMLYLDDNGILKAKDIFKYTEYNLVNDYHKDGKQSVNYLIKKKVQDLYGVYDNNMKAEIAKHWYGKLVLMFKNFFMSQAIYRYKGMTTAHKSKDQLDDEDLDFNNAEQEFTEGIYTTFVRTFYPLLRHLNLQMTKENLKNLSDYEKANLKQVFFEISMTAIILPLLGAILASSASGDDDDNIYFYLFAFRRLESELSQFRNLPELNRMITNPVAANRFLQNGFTVINDIFTPINFTPKNNESYFDWLSENNKGENIMLNHAFKLAPGRSFFLNTYKQRFILMDR